VFDCGKGDAKMKTTLAALVLAALAATPTMANSYRHSRAIAPSPGYAESGAYGAYAYEPAMTGVVIQNGIYAGADPDADVRLQLQKQADINYNR
jgi:hypothetical protein